MVVSGRDVLFSKESDKASNVSNKDTTAAAAGGTRRRQPPPDGYLYYDVSKTKEIQHMSCFALHFLPHGDTAFSFSDELSWAAAATGGDSWR